MAKNLFWLFLLYFKINFKSLKTINKIGESIDMEETGLKKLMKDLGVKDFKELNEYINNPLHREEAIVIEFKKFLEYLKNKGE